MEVKRIVFFAPVCVLFVVSLLDIFGTNKHRNLTQNRIVQVLVKHGEAEAEALTVDVTFPKRYTVLVNTFRGRDDAVLEVLKGYSKCDRVDKVFVVWNDFERPIPHNIASFAAESQGSIVIQVQKSTSLSNRWLVPDLVETTAIFSTDEDIMYSCTALEAAFSEWLKDPDRLVGFAPRNVELKSDLEWEMGGYRYETFYLYKNRHAYIYGHFTTVWPTKGAFINRRFFQLYFQDSRFAKARALADRFITGEDITMSFTHALNVQIHHKTGIKNNKVVAILLPRDSNHVTDTYTGKSSLYGSTSSHRYQIFNEITKALLENGEERVLDEMRCSNFLSLSVDSQNNFHLIPCNDRKCSVEALHI